MDRLIKFRGQGLEYVEWIFGGIAHDREAIINEDYLAIPVDRNTVGQFTGAYDREGNEIYEGDIIEAISPSGDKLRSQISFVDSVCCFALKPPLKTPTTDAMQLRPFRSEKFYKVIGNIYDNPELLEEEEIDD